jgi:glutamine phosphoribosylpyrophosphate amidotransferase
MLGRKDYTQDEYDQARAAVAQQIASFKKVATIVDKAGGDKKTAAAFDGFEAVYFNNMAVVLDRYFVHRVRMATGKDGNAINELELITDSLMNNAGTFRGNNVIKYVPESSVLKLKVGDPIALSLDDFERLADAFFEELNRKFL